MKRASDLIGFEKDGKPFPYVGFEIYNGNFTDKIYAAIKYFLRDKNGNKIPYMELNHFIVIDIKANRETIVFVIE